MNDRLSGITAFVHTAEAGSFAQAAERLHLTRSAVGKTIARLEERLGVRLFHRTTRHQRLTDEGQAFYERCVRALAELDAAEAALDNGRREPVGRLRVSVPVLFGRHCVAPILLDLAARYPQLELDVSFTDRRVDLIDEGIDLAVRSGALDDSATLTARRLGTQHMVVCAAPSYLAAHGTPRTLDELGRHAGVVYSRTGAVPPWRFLDADGREREIKMASRVRFDDLDAIAAAAMAGAGLARLPGWLIADALRTGALVRVLGDERGVGFELYAVWPPSRHLPSKVRVAVDELVARVPALLAFGADAAGPLPGA